MLHKKEDSLNNQKVLINIQQNQLQIKSQILNSYDSIHKLSSNTNNKIYTLNNLKDKYSKQEREIVPNITGRWYSTLYKGQEVWDIDTTSKHGTLNVILTRPGSNIAFGTATYIENAEFIMNIVIADNGKLASLQYTWKVIGLNPDAINYNFTVIRSQIAYTPIGTKQADSLVRRYP